MASGTEIASAVSALAGIIARALGLIDELRAISPHTADLYQQLKTLADVLEHTHNDFKWTLELNATHNESDTGLDVTTRLLSTCIADCTTTCSQYETLLQRISSSGFKALQWKRSQSEFNRLHTMLEARKSTLLTVLTAIRQFADNVRRSTERTVPIRSVHSPPPSYGSLLPGSPVFYSSRSASPGSYSPDRFVSPISRSRRQNDAWDNYLDANGEPILGEMGSRLDRHGGPVPDGAGIHVDRWDDPVDKWGRPVGNHISPNTRRYRPDSPGCSVM